MMQAAQRDTERNSVGHDEDRQAPAVRGQVETGTSSEDTGNILEIRRTTFVERIM